MPNFSKKEEENFEEIKSEGGEDDGCTLGFGESDDDFDDETESLITDQEGTQYYCDAGFRIKQVSDPIIINYTLKSLFDASRRGDLKLDPEYQRDVVWDEARSSGLIASIFQGYFIPPIIFNKKSEYDGSSENGLRIKRTCVDGKQRLTSVRNFMEGLIGVPDSCSPLKKWYFCHPIVNEIQQVSRHNILPESTKVFFQNRTFCCYEYNDLPASVEENMFQLVQRGVPLTPAERMRALSTNWAAFGKRIEEDYPQVVNLSKQTRGSGFRCVITIFSQIKEVISQKENRSNSREAQDSSPSLHAAPQTLTRLLLDEKSLTENYKLKYKEVFDKFQELVDLSSTRSPHTKLGYIIIFNSAFDPTPDYLKSRNINHVKTFSPLELVATATLIAAHGESRTSATLLDDIKEMRIYLRQNHQDLRLNNQCWATAWKFIYTYMVNIRGGLQAVLGGGMATSPDKESSDGEPVTANRRARIRLDSVRGSVAAIAAKSTTPTGHFAASGSAAAGEFTAADGMEDTIGISGRTGHPPYIIHSPWRLADTMSDSGGPISRLAGSAPDGLQMNMDIDG